MLLAIIVPYTILKHLIVITVFQIKPMNIIYPKILINNVVKKDKNTILQLCYVKILQH